MGNILIPLGSIFLGFALNQAIQAGYSKSVAASWIYAQVLVTYLASVRAKALSKRARAALNLSDGSFDYSHICNQLHAKGGKWVSFANRYIFWQRAIAALGFSFFGVVVSQLIGSVL